MFIVAHHIDNIHQSYQTAHGQVSDAVSDAVYALAINDLGPVAHLKANSLSLGFIDDQQTHHSGLGFFPNAQNVLVSGGTFVGLFFSLMV